MGILELFLIFNPLTHNCYSKYDDFLTFYFFGPLSQIRRFLISYFSANSYTESTKFLFKSYEFQCLIFKKKLDLRQIFSTFHTPEPGVELKI